jgi:hypothetical protein
MIGFSGEAIQQFIGRLPPLFVLGVLVCISLSALLIDRAIRRARRKALTALARSWQMHYTPRDIFQLAPRIAPLLPVPGAADVHVTDLIYGTEPAGHRYIFCAEYTVGVVRAKRRRRCVLSVLEPRHRTDGSEFSANRLAPEGLPLLEQYRSLGRETATDVV